MQYSLSPDPSAWGVDISPQAAEPDDHLHNPDARRDRKIDRSGNIFTSRSLANLGCLILLVTGIVALLWVRVIVPILTITLTFIQRRLSRNLIFYQTQSVRSWWIQPRWDQRNWTSSPDAWKLGTRGSRDS